jgi:hypothetical protein
VDVSRELIEKGLINRYVPIVIRAIAIRASQEMVEKWAGRVIPVLSSAVGGGLNYYFVRAWSERAMQHFREKHLNMRNQITLEARQPSDQP